MSYKKQEGRLSSREGVLVDGAAKCHVALFATGISGAGGWEDTEVIVSVNHLLKGWDV